MESKPLHPVYGERMCVCIIPSLTCSFWCVQVYLGLTTHRTWAVSAAGYASLTLPLSRIELQATLYDMISGSMLLE